jgi:polyhydroxybutyrate depolymerase
MTLASLPARIRQGVVLLVALVAAGCAEDTRISVQSGGVARQATIDRPTPAAGPRPLLVVLHAATLSGSLVRRELELPEPARRAGVVLAFPDAERQVWNDGSFALALPPSFAAGDDVGFLDALIAAQIADGTADPAAIHLAGVSNGGMMALRYACLRAERIASVAVFLATMPLPQDQPCRPARPLSVLMVAGTADPVMRWNGEVTMAGLAVLQQRLSVPDSFAFWRRQNGCTGLAAPRPLPRRGDPWQPGVMVHAATGCAGGVLTELHEVRGGGHRVATGDDWTLLRLLGRASPDFAPGDLLVEFALRATRTRLSAR